MPPGGRLPVQRIWLAFADHFEPWWRNPTDDVALARVRRWSTQWPAVAARHRDSAGRPPCYTFFYPEEQYHPAAMDALAALRDAGVGDVEVHLHHDGDTPESFRRRMNVFLHRLRHRHGLLREDAAGIRFGFIHGNWALDNSLPGGRFCGLDREIALLDELGCYADFTLPAAPSPAQTPTVNRVYWAKEDGERRSHDRGVAVTAGGPVAGDLMIVPGPLTINFADWRRPGVPRLECGEIAGNCLPTPHRAELWTRVAPRIGGDVFIKLFAHGAPEHNAVPMLKTDGLLDRTLRYVERETVRHGASLHFVSAWQMWSAIDALRRRVDPIAAADAAGADLRARVSAS
jgi:hypothetical protein